MERLSQEGFTQIHGQRAYGRRDSSAQPSGLEFELEAVFRRGLGGRGGVDPSGCKDPAEAGVLDRTLLLGGRQGAYPGLGLGLGSGFGLGLGWLAAAWAAAPTGGSGEGGGGEGSGCRCDYG